MASGFNTLSSPLLLIVTYSRQRAPLPHFICCHTLKCTAMVTKPSGHKGQSEDKPPNDISQVPSVGPEADPATCSLVVPAQGKTISGS